MFNEGISRAGEVLDLGVMDDAIEKRGSFYSYEGTRLGQGRENVKSYLNANPELLDAIENQIRAMAGLPQRAV